ncbi:Uncharacterised protein [Escherichia coli]|nr:Uncharacterised protein [Escherichia coli]
MDELKNFSATDWLFFATLLIVWFYMVVKAYSWLIGVLLHRGWRLWNRKDEQTLAMDSFYEAFRLADIEAWSESGYYYRKRYDVPHHSAKR